LLPSFPLAIVKMKESCSLEQSISSIFVLDAMFLSDSLGTVWGGFKFLVFKCNIQNKTFSKNGAQMVFNSISKHFYIHFQNQEKRM